MRQSIGVACAIVCVVLVATPAVAADNLACLTGAVSAKISRDVFADYRAKKEMGEALGAALGDRVGSCLVANDWSQEATESAVRVVLGRILVEGLGREIASHRIDASALAASLDRYLDRLPVEDLRALADGEASEAHGEAIVRQVVGDEVVTLSRLDDRLAALIGEYAAGRANERHFATVFAGQ